MKHGNILNLPDNFPFLTGITDVSSSLEDLFGPIFTQEPWFPSLTTTFPTKLHHLAIKLGLTFWENFFSMDFFPPFLSLSSFIILIVGLSLVL